MNAIGFLAGKSLSAGLTAAAGAGVAGIGLALTKGFERLEKIDSATSKLNQMNKVAERMGKPLIDVQKTVTAVMDSVNGTPYSLDAAFGIAVQAIGAGSKDIGKFMKDVTDAAGFAGDDLGHMGLVLTQVLSKGKADGGDMMQLMEAGLPAKSWIEDSYNLTSDQFQKMQADGEITMDMLQKSIEDHAGDMAKAAGDTLEGSIVNMQTADARAGADFLSAIFGGPGGDPTQGMKEAVNRITDYLKKLDDWINAHREDIKKFFDGAKEAAADVLKVVGNLGDVLKTHPDLIKNVLEAFALWKTIKFTGLLGALGEVSTALGAAGLLGKLTLVLEAMNLIDDFTNKQKPGVSEPVNAGPPIGKQAIDIAAGAYVGGKLGGVPGAIIGGATAGMVRPGIDIVSDGPGPAFNGVLPNAPGQINGQTPNVGGIPIPGLSQKITPTVDTGPALASLGALRDGQKEPIVIPADSDTAPASGTTGAWRTDEAGNPVVIPVDADTTSASASMAAFIDQWSSAIISPKVVVPGQVTPGPTGGPPTLAGLLGVPGRALGGGISGPGTGTSDSIPALLSHGEHVLTAKDVAATLNTISAQLKDASNTLKAAAPDVAAAAAEVAKNAGPTVGGALSPLIGGARASMLTAMPRSVIAGGARHCVEQAAVILKHRKISCLFTTPLLLEALDELINVPDAGIKGVFCGGTSMTPQTVRFSVEEVLDNRAQFVPTYGNTLMGLACSRPISAADKYSITYHAPQPRAVLRVVNPDMTEETVPYGEWGRVELTTLTKEFFMPRFLERDEAIRREPFGRFAWDGVAEVRPFGALSSTTIEGVY
jgi:tape measure domain-containing protein